MLTGRELPCILDDTLNEVNVSTINAMSKMTLTWVKCPKRPCFLLAFLFVLFSPKELLQCGTSSPWRGQTPWFEQTVSTQWSPPLSKGTRVSLPLLTEELCSQWRHHSLAGMLWVPALCLVGQDPHQGKVLPSAPLLILPAPEKAKQDSARGSVHAIPKCNFGEMLQGNSALRG